MKIETENNIYEINDVDKLEGKTRILSDRGFKSITRYNLTPDHFEEIRNMDCPVITDKLGFVGVHESCNLRKDE